MTQLTSAQLSIRVGEIQVKDAEILNCAWNGCTAHHTRGVHEIITTLARDIMAGSLLEQALVRGNRIEPATANQQAREFHAAAFAHGNMHWSISQASRHRGGEAKLCLWAPNPDVSGENIGVSIPFSTFVGLEPRGEASRRRTRADQTTENLVRLRSYCDEAIATVNHALRHLDHAGSHPPGPHDGPLGFGGYYRPGDSRHPRTGTHRNTWRVEPSDPFGGAGRGGRHTPSGRLTPPHKRPHHTGGRESPQTNAELIRALRAENEELRDRLGFTEILFNSVINPVLDYNRQAQRNIEEAKAARKEARRRLGEEYRDPKAHHRNVTARDALRLARERK